MAPAVISCSQFSGEIGDVLAGRVGAAASGRAERQRTFGVGWVGVATSRVRRRATERPERRSRVEQLVERHVERIRARTIIFFAVRVKAWKAWP